MLAFLIYLLILVIVASVVWWALSQFPLPAPIANIVRVLVVVIFCVILIWLLLGFIPAIGTPLRR